ncbi:hypothetical protein [Cohnella panacarvi]|uniref:hypothetical protein n=1 Tax=Cohnella panacarvi TaxID=400776 RepID=UPI0012EC0B8C|nr:hypothetical protein [Cohnella panacarvi]
MRRSFIISIFIVIIALMFGYNFRPWIVPNTYVSGWGASSTKSETNINTQNINFDATIKNDGHYSVYVKEVQVLFADSIKNKFQSGNQKISVNKWLKPNETWDVNGEWIFDSSGIKENNIMIIPNYATFKVNIFPF